MAVPGAIPLRETDLPQEVVHLQIFHPASTIVQMESSIMKAKAAIMMTMACTMISGAVIILLMEHIMMDRVVTGMAMAITAPDLEAALREAVHPEAAPREAVHLEEVLLVLRSMTAVEALQAAVRQEAIQELMMTAI